MTELTKEEKETYISTTEADKTATIYSNSRNWILRMKKLAEMYPDKVTFVREDKYGAEFTFPKKWMKVSPPRIISEEQRAAAADRLKKYRLAREQASKE